MSKKQQHELVKALRTSDGNMDVSINMEPNELTSLVMHFIQVMVDNSNEEGMTFNKMLDKLKIKENK